MSPEQKNLARNALGLPNDSNASIRNYFTIRPDPTSSVYQTWLAMIENGYAERLNKRAQKGGRNEIFRLTDAGAKAALNNGEHLSPKNFPLAA